MSSVTQILSAIEQGDRSRAEELLPLVYEELRRLAAARLANEKPGWPVSTKPCTNSSTPARPGSSGSGSASDDELAVTGVANRIGSAIWNVPPMPPIDEGAAAPDEKSTDDVVGVRLTVSIRTRPPTCEIPVVAI